MNRDERRELPKDRSPQTRDGVSAQPRIVTLSLGISSRVLPWERELLLRHVQELLESVLLNPQSDDEEE